MSYEVKQPERLSSNTKELLVGGAVVLAVITAIVGALIAGCIWYNRLPLYAVMLTYNNGQQMVTQVYHAPYHHDQCHEFVARENWKQDNSTVKQFIYSCKELDEKAKEAFRR